MQTTNSITVCAWLLPLNREIWINFLLIFFLIWSPAVVQHSVQIFNLRSFHMSITQYIQMRYIRQNFFWDFTTYSSYEQLNTRSIAISISVNLYVFCNLFWKLITNNFSRTNLFIKIYYWTLLPHWLVVNLILKIVHKINEFQ